MEFEHGIFKTPLVFPLPKIIVNSVVWREVLGEHSPLATTHKRVKDGIHNFNKRVFAIALFMVKVFFNRVPLVVSDVGWIICHNRVNGSSQNYEEIFIYIAGNQFVNQYNY